MLLKSQSTIGTAYTKAQINAAATKTLQLASQKKTLGSVLHLSHHPLTLLKSSAPPGKDKYPHVYNDYEKFKYPQAVMPYLEFPILASGQVYAGGSPSTDRVVLGSIAADFKSAVYCGIITHQGESDNAFMMCRDDTMNLHGVGDEIPSGENGGEEGHKGKREQRHEHGDDGRRGRKLVEKIEME